MSQKINPISLRLQETNRFFDSCWYSDNYYTELVCRDIKMQMYLNSILKQLSYPTARLFIQNIPKKLKISVFYFDPRKSRKNKLNFFNLPNNLRQVKKNLSLSSKNTKKRNTLFSKVKFYSSHSSIPSNFSISLFEKKKKNILFKTARKKLF